MDITATGPDMWIGKVGHFCIILAFVSAILAAIGFWMSASNRGNSKEISWKNLGKMAFLMHGLSVLCIVGLLFYMMAAKKYVYAYVYQHASNDLPFRYLFAAFWEGQEGSTLLWAFWHVILGFILLFNTRKWQAPVLGTVSLVQVFLLSMVLGIYVLEHRIGVNPFQLLRNTVGNAPIFAQNPNFVPQDGKGLNELLRNYWMVIHPPTVFLGFASITILFGYALGGLFWRELRDWITPALPWALLSGGVLGIGVLMGGAWAYEALSFGGFWAWDPVENASLVPWLIIVAALHLMLVFRATSYSGISTFFFVILSFILVAYSTFLTKSGVLGEASVHSFTDLGMSGQLIVFILFFWVLAFTLLLSNRKMRGLYLIGNFVLFVFYLITKQSGFVLFAFILFTLSMLATIKDFPTKEEEKLWSREFWMFVGSLALFLSAMHIILATSTPVYNKLFDKEYSVFDQPHFNSIEIWPAIIIVLLSAIVLYFSYHKEDKIAIAKQFGFSIFSSVVFTALIIYWYNFTNIAHILLIFFGIFSAFANANYLIFKLRGRVKIGGGTIAHIGFAVLMVGIVISQSKEVIISKNLDAFVNVLEESDSEEAQRRLEDFNENNVLIYENQPKQIGNYMVTLKEDVDGKLRDGVVIDFKELYDRKIVDEFSLTPKFKAMEDNLIADPAIKRGVFEDFFTHISLIRLRQNYDTTSFEPIPMTAPKDTITFDQMAFILNGMNQGTTRTDIELQENDIPISADMRIITVDSVYDVEPVYLIRGNQAALIPADIPEEKISVRLNEINPESGSNNIEIGVRNARPFKKYVLLKIMIFPLINLVWLGSILMFFGFIISLIDRRKQSIRAN